jgi:hypothetical protein
VLGLVGQPFESVADALLELGTGHAFDAAEKGRQFGQILRLGQRADFAKLRLDPFAVEVRDDLHCLVIFHASSLVWLPWRILASVTA